MEDPQQESPEKKTAYWNPIKDYLEDIHLELPNRTTEGRRWYNPSRNWSNPHLDPYGRPIVRTTWQIQLGTTHIFATRTTRQIPARNHMTNSPQEEPPDKSSPDQMPT